jgi:hypothetical protein
MGDSRGLLDDKTKAEDLVGPTTLSSKKLWVVFFTNLMAFIAFFHSAWLATPEMQDTLFGHYLTFLVLFNTAYAGINMAQKWALK